VPGRRRIGGSGGDAGLANDVERGAKRSVGMRAGSEVSSWPQTPQKRASGGKLAWQAEQRREVVSAMTTEDSAGRPGIGKRPPQASIPGKATTPSERG